MAPSISQVVERIKGEVSSVLPGDVIHEICRELGYRWRTRVLDPVTTLHAFLLQVLHGNTACDHVPHLLNRRFTGEAYCQARARLPLELFQRLIQAVCGFLGSCCPTSSGWHGHRVWLLDGSSFSMPDTEELQRTFGQPGGQRAGCGFPVAHLLALFDFTTGMLMRVCVSPLRTHDMSQVGRVHDDMQPGDVVVGDRGFCSYGHLALLILSGIHGVFRAHQKTIVNFRKGRSHRPLRGKRSPSKSKKGQPTSRWVKWLGQTDQVVESFKPLQRPDWMTAEEYQKLPASILVRELRYRVDRRGYRTKEVLLVTTLLDSAQYSADDLADLYGKRWTVETNLKHLKQTLGMDILRTKSLDNILKEVSMFMLVYNLVRLVMLNAAEQQHVLVNRISFQDALRWLCHATFETLDRPLNVNPDRRGRVEPRVRKRRPKKYPVMRKPRSQLKQALMAQWDNA